MRFSKFAVVSTGVLVLAACGGSGDKAPAPASQAPAATPATKTPPAPITGVTKVVQMIGDDKGSRFDPATITIKQGDGIKFEVVSLPPHNISFDPAALSPEAKAAFMIQMPDQDVGELSGKLLQAGDTWTMSFANIPPGTYEAICAPHLAMGMKMKIIVQ